MPPSIEVPSAGATVTLDQCAAYPLPIHQWTAADGTARGVRIRALTFRDRMLAEQAATNKDGTINAYRLMAEETVKGIYDPPGLTVDHVLSWNADVVATVHQSIVNLGGLAAAGLAAALARAADGPPPEPGPARGGGDAAAHGVGGGPVPAPGPAPEPAREPLAE